ncbi:MAG: radical SAM protein [Candidatus Lokiarchaeota archaeon]|nr:radical SAM protein [Candidatus Lokiarchaeota archaeon]
MVKTSLRVKGYHSLETENVEFPKRLLDTKAQVKSIKFDLLIWNLINKFNFTKFFHLFKKNCPSCGRKFSEIFIDYYITREITCKKCKYKTIFSTFLISFVLNAVSRSLNIPKKRFPEILRENEPLKRLALSYIEGIGMFGMKTPTIPIGPPVVFWSVTHRCNLNCTHCYVDQDAKEMSYSDACKIIDQLSEAKNFILIFFGGEALLRDDIFDLMRYATDKKINVALASNGTLINKDIAKNLKEIGVGYVQVSIDGLKDVHEQIRGEGTFEKAISAIKLCLNEGLYTCIGTTITKLNVHQIYELVDLAKSLKVQKFEIVDFVPSGKASLQAHITLTPLQIEKFSVIVCDIWQKLIEEGYPMTLSYKNPIFGRILSQRFPKVIIAPFFKSIFSKEALSYFNFSERLQSGVFSKQSPFSPFITGCECGVFTMHIKSNGEVTPCPLNPASLGNVNKHHIQKIWIGSPILNQYRNLKYEGQCGKCNYKSICGGCRAKAFISTGSSITSDPTCMLEIRNIKI